MTDLVSLNNLVKLLVLHFKYKYKFAKTIYVVFISTSAKVWAEIRFVQN